MCVKEMHEIIKKEEIKIKLMQQLIIAHARFDDCRLANEEEIQDAPISNRLLRNVANTAQNNMKGPSQLIRKRTLGVGSKRYKFDKKEIQEFVLLNEFWQH